MEALIPGDAARARLHAIIYDELILGMIAPGSKSAMLQIIADARREQGCDGVILGCTEFGLLIGPDDVDLPVIDTTVVHADAGVAFMLG